MDRITSLALQMIDISNQQEASRMLVQCIGARHASSTRVVATRPGRLVGSTYRICCPKPFRRKKKNVMVKHACIRSRDAKCARLHKRVVVALDTILREILDLPQREDLQNPLPVSRETCVEYLNIIIKHGNHGGAA